VNEVYRAAGEPAKSLTKLLVDTHGKAEEWTDDAANQGDYNVEHNPANRQVLTGIDRAGICDKGNPGDDSGEQRHVCCPSRE
jgi:hypothetical protein